MKGYESMKRVKEIQGMAVTLEVGIGAAIYCTDGDIIWTSQVLDLRNHTNSGVEFETKNTIYKLKFEEIKITDELPCAV